MRDRRRQHLGKYASAALVPVWGELERRGWSDADFAEELAEHSGKISRLLYGDRRPGRALAAKILARLGTPIEAWDRPCPVKRRIHATVALPEQRKSA